MKNYLNTFVVHHLQSGTTETVKTWTASFKSVTSILPNYRTVPVLNLLVYNGLFTWPVVILQLRRRVSTLRPSGPSHTHTTTLQFTLTIYSKWTNLKYLHNLLFLPLSLELQFSLTFFLFFNVIYLFTVFYCGILGMSVQKQGISHIPHHLYLVSLSVWQTKIIKTLKWPAVIEPQQVKKSCRAQSRELWSCATACLLKGY